MRGTAEAVDELGAHVSTRGGVENAPERSREVGGVVFQIFTKVPNRWAEPEIGEDQAAAPRGLRRGGDPLDCRPRFLPDQPGQPEPEPLGPEPALVQVRAPALSRSRA